MASIDNFVCYSNSILTVLNVYRNYISKENMINDNTN